MKVLEASSPTRHEPVEAVFNNLKYACWSEDSAIDRWTNEGGALDGSSFVRDVRAAQSTDWMRDQALLTNANSEDEVRC